MDNDGRLDRIVVRFLGSLSQQYLEQMIDSLVFDWVDSSENVIHYSIPSQEMRLDSLNARQVIVDISETSLLKLTTTSELFFPVGNLGTAKLFCSDSLVYTVPVLDAMPPSIGETLLKSHRGKKSDSLTVKFTEPVELVEGCTAYLEFKSSKDSIIRSVFHSDLRLDPLLGIAYLVIDENATQNVRLSPGDSLRAIKTCVRDSSRNGAPGNAFVSVYGYYPIELETTSLVREKASHSENRPIFQLLFDESKEIQNDEANAWEITMEVLDDEFENSIREFKDIPRKASLDLSKLKITYNIRIYTNLGQFVVATNHSVYGNDERFKYRPTYLKLRWNLMDSRGRHVATGAYIANISVLIEYDGDIVYRSLTDSQNSSFSFGIIRR